MKKRTVLFNKQKYETISKHIFKQYTLTKTKKIFQAQLRK